MARKVGSINKQKHYTLDESTVKALREWSEQYKIEEQRIVDIAILTCDIDKIVDIDEGLKTELDLADRVKRLAGGK